MIRRKTTDPAAPVAFFDTSTPTGQYITAQIAGAGANPQDPQAILEFIAANDAKAKATVGIALVAVAVALLVWWGQKKGNLPKALDFVRGKTAMAVILAGCAFLAWRGYAANKQNKEVQAALADFIKWAQAIAAAQQQATASTTPT